MATRRRPNWEKWCNCFDAEIWEAVALSLNIEPSEVQHHPQSWMAGTHLFKEPPEFDDRVDTVLRNVGQRPELSLTTASVTDRVRNKVSLAGFAQFAKSLAWKLPSKFPGQTPATSTGAVDKVRWLSRDAWSEAELRGLLCGEQPGSAPSSISEANEALEDIRRAVLVHELLPHAMPDATAADKFYAHHRFYGPEHAIRWATQKAGRFPKFPFSIDDIAPRSATPVSDYLCGKVLIGFSAYLSREAARRQKAGEPGADALLVARSVLSNQLDNSPLAAEEVALLEQQNAPQAGANEPTDKPLGERERSTLLVLIGALAKAVVIDITAPSKAAVQIEAMTEQLGAPVAARTIENHLNRIPDAIERKG